MNNTVHFILQSKGGIGKSFVAALVSEYVQSKSPKMIAFDTDQFNSTLSQYPSFNAQKINLLDSQHSINPKQFDQMILDIIESPEPAVIDTGANSFTALLNYIISNKTFELLKENGKKITIHTIIAGGDMRDDTANGFNSLAKATQVPIILWLNEHFGSTAKDDGDVITNSELIRQHQQSIIGVVWLSKQNPQTFGVDIQSMTKNRFTTIEAVASTKYHIVEKQRIVMFSREVFQQLDKIEFAHE